MSKPYYTPFAVRYARPAEFVPEHTPTFRLQEYIDEAKREMTPERWAELNRLWEEG